MLTTRLWECIVFIITTVTVLRVRLLAFHKPLKAMAICTDVMSCHATFAYVLPNRNINNAIKSNANHNDDWPIKDGFEKCHRLTKCWTVDPLYSDWIFGVPHSNFSAVDRIFSVGYVFSSEVICFFASLFYWKIF